MWHLSGEAQSAMGNEKREESAPTNVNERIASTKMNASAFEVGTLVSRL